MAYVNFQRVSRDALLMPQEELLQLRGPLHPRTRLGDCISLGANDKTSSVKSGRLFKREQRRVTGAGFSPSQRGLGARRLHRAGQPERPGIGGTRF